MNRFWKSAALAAFLCSGCGVGPKYQRPTAQVPAGLKELAGNEQWKMATPSDSLIKGKWWEIFGDPQLNALEEQVNINNQDVKQAEAQYREARAIVAANHADYYPSVGTTPAITESDFGKNTGRPAGSTTSYSIPGDVTWEPDLWSRVRLSVQNAARNAQLSAADLQNVKLSEQALLATDYFSLAAEDMQEGILHDTIDAYQKNLQLTINRYNGGVASKSDITLAQTQLAGAQAQSTDLHIARAQYEHAIAVLTGRPPSRGRDRYHENRRATAAGSIGRSFATFGETPRRRGKRTASRRSQCKYRTGKNGVLPNVVAFSEPRPAFNQPRELVCPGRSQLVRRAGACGNRSRFRPAQSRRGTGASRI